MKRSFSLLELIFILLIVAIVTTHSNLKNNLSKIKLAKQQLILHLKYTRYIAMLDDKYDSKDSLWHKKRWTLKFERCDSDIGGMFYMIYSDEDENGFVRKIESLKDPLSNNYIYAANCKEDSLYDKSKFVLLSQTYDIEKVEVSCNTTTSLGKISFGNDGNVYSKLGNNEEENKLISPCIIQLTDKYNQIEEIIIHPNTGYIEG